MNFELNKKDYVIIILVLASCIVVTFLLNKFIYKNNRSNSIKKNEYNTYTSNYITNDRQASIYLSRYYYLLNNSIEEAYKLVDENSLITFSDLNDFKNYLNGLNISNSKVIKLNCYKKGEYTFYEVIDGNNNNIVFKTKGIMYYTVIFK